MRESNGVMVFIVFVGSALLTASAIVAVKHLRSVPSEGMDNTTVGAQWERIADVADGHGVYKVVDTEDGVLCYYTVLSNAVSLSCMPWQVRNE